MLGEDEELYMIFPPVCFPCCCAMYIFHITKLQQNFTQASVLSWSLQYYFLLKSTSRGKSQVMTQDGQNNLMAKAKQIVQFNLNIAFLYLENTLDERELQLYAS